MLDRLAKTEGMCPPSSFLDMNGNVGQSVGMPEYHYTQAWDQVEWDFQPFNFIATRMDPAKAALVGEIERVRSASTTVNQAALKTGPRCQVLECSADLTVGHKDYHARYRICERCLKCPCVVRAGVRERFCQQCGRFHPVEAFDGDKRSCRDRLQRHNARRRKTKPAGEGSTSTLLQFQSMAPAPSLPPVVEASLPAPGTQDMPPFKKPHITPALPGVSQAVRLNWVPAPRPDPLLESGLPDILEPKEKSVKDSFSPYSVLSPPTETSGASTIFDEGIMDTALSLNSDLGALGGNNMIFNFAALGSQPDLMPQGVEMSKLEYKAYNFQVATPDHSEFGLLSDHMSYGIQGDGRLSPVHRSLSGIMDETMFSLDQSAAIKQEPGMRSNVDAAMHSFKEANHLVNLSMGYEPVHVRQRMSTKMMDCTPEQLPLELKMQLMTLLQCGQNDLDAYIRPGCVHLTVNMSLDQNCGQHVSNLSARAAANNLLQGTGAEFWASRTLLVQLNNEVALVKGGKVLRVLDGYASQGVYPTIDRIAPLCVSTKGPASVKLFGINLRSSNNVMIARCQGLHATLKPEEPFVDDVVDAEDDDEEEVTEEVTVKLPSPRRNGAMQIEMIHGGYMSSCKSVLVLDNDEAVDEINSITPELCTAIGLDLESFMTDLDNLLELQNALAASSRDRDRLRKYSAADYQRLAIIGRRIFVLCLSQGWPALARLVLPVAVMGQKSVEKTIEEMHTISRGLSLLHLAVRSQNPKMVKMLLEWSSANGCEWSAAMPGPGGVTPMHMAAILKDGGELAALLTVLCMDGKAAWGVKVNGLTPFDMAKIAGTAEAVQKQLTSAITAIHKAQEDAYLATLEQMKDDEEGEYEDDEEEYEIDPETGEIINLDQFQGMKTARHPDPEPIPEWGPPPKELPVVKRGPLPEPNPAQASSSTSNDSAASFIKATKHEMRSEGGSGSSSSAPMADMDDDEDSMEAWKQGDATKQTNMYRPDPLYGDNICMVDVNGNMIVPTVFDRMSASCSGLLITLIGGATLAARYSFDCLA